MAQYIQAFLVGGIICVIGQILIDKTNMTPARILVTFLCAGVALYAVGLYQPLVDFGGAGATVPLTGFGYSLAKGTLEGVRENGILGIFSGGLKATSSGIAAAIIFGFLFALLAKPGDKQ